LEAHDWIFSATQFRRQPAAESFAEQTVNCCHSGTFITGGRRSDDHGGLGRLRDLSGKKDLGVHAGAAGTDARRALGLLQPMLTVLSCW